MLAYLDALLAALILRDGAEIVRLLDQALARSLPNAVRDEARTFADGRCDARSSPLRVLQFRHQTSELMREEAAGSPLASRPAPPSLSRRRGRLVQMELPLSA